MSYHYSMPLLTLPSLAVVVAPYGSGKTSILKFLILEQCEKIAGIVLFSNTGRDAWNENYSWLNPLYIYDRFDEEIIARLKKLGKRIKKANPDHHLVLIFDDSVGLAKSMFKGPEAKKLLTTLRHYGVSILISTHQLQTEVSTLIRNNVRDLILFQQSDPAGTKIAAETWGLPSTNLNNIKEFQAKIGSLPKYHFLHYNTQTHFWQTCQIPYPLPDFRIALHPSDTFVEGKKIVYGNASNYDLSSIERPEDEIDEIDDDEKTPLYRKDPETDSDADRDVDEEAPEDDVDDVIQDLAADLKEPEPEPVKPVKRKLPKIEHEVTKKPKKDATQNLLEEIDMSEQNQGMNENLSKEDLIIRHRILHQLKYIQGTPGNPDLELLNDRNPSFLSRNFDQMTYQELKDAYREYANHKAMNGMICGIENRYNGIESVVHQFARSALDYHGDPTIFTGHLKGMRHEAVLSAIAKSNPYTKAQISTVDQLASVVLPMATVGWAVWNHKANKEEHKKSAEKGMEETEIDMYLNRIPEPVDPLV
jgi:hypothetical protein